MNLANHMIGTHMKDSYEFYDYLTLHRELDPNYLCNVWSGNKEFLVESTKDKTRFLITVLSDYSRGKQGYLTTLSYFPNLSFPLLVL